VKHMLLAGLFALALVACSSTDTQDNGGKTADNTGSPTPDTPKDTAKDPAKDPPANPPKDPPADPPKDPPADPPKDPPADPPKDPPADPPKDPPADPPKDPPADPPKDPPADPPKDPPVDPPAADPADALVADLGAAVTKYREEFDALSSSLDSSSDMAATLNDFAGKWETWIADVAGKVEAHKDNAKLGGWSTKLDDLKAALASAKEKSGSDPKAALAALDVWK